MTLTYQDRNAQARAVMLLSDRQEIFSNDIKLPNVTQLDLTNVSYVLNINGKKVNTEKCLKSVHVSTLDISYDVVTSQSLRTELRITSDNKTDLWRDTKEGSFPLSGLSVEAASDVYFTFNLCGFSEKKVLCTFIKGEHYGRNGPTIEILFASFALFILSVIILLATLIFFCKVKTKRKRFQRKNQETTLAVLEKESGDNPGCPRERIRRQPWLSQRKNQETTLAVPEKESGDNPGCPRERIRRQPWLSQRKNQETTLAVTEKESGDNPGCPRERIRRQS
nr:polymorphic transmembrane cluster 2 transmembrane protein 4 [Biomphalaria glabrata]